MTQPVAGTFPAGFAAGATLFKIKSGTLEPSRDLLITDPEIGGGRDRSDAYLGAVSFGGSLDFYVRLESLTTLLQSALGTGASATTTGVTTHTFTPSDLSSLPLLALEERIGNTFERFQYTDGVVDTLHVEAEANGYFQGTVGLIAKKQVVVGTDSAVTLEDDSPLIVGTNISITYNGVTLPAKSFSLDITNNYESDDFRLGSLFLGDLTPKGREVSANVVIRPQDSALWKQAVYGASSATQAGGIATKQALVITCSSYEDIEGGTPLTKNSISFTIPKAILNPHAVSPSGDDVLEETIDITAVRPAVGTPIMTTVVKTGAATIA